MKDLHNNIAPAVALDTLAISTNTTSVGNIIDMQGFEALEFLIQSGTVTDGTFLPLIEDGDDSGLSDVAAVSDANLLGTEVGAQFVAADDNAVKRVGYRGGKRYVRLSIVSTGTSTGVDFMSAIAVRAGARHLPTA